MIHNTLCRKCSCHYQIPRNLRYADGWIARWSEREMWGLCLSPLLPPSSPPQTRRPLPLWPYARTFMNVPLRREGAKKKMLLMSQITYMSDRLQRHRSEWHFTDVPILIDQYHSKKELARVTNAYSDTLPSSRGCHCGRSGLYHEKILGLLSP